jgi:hypothetical protein
MKKLRLKKRTSTKDAIPTRITNETVAEHRERILAGGRRFKYPMQYARHRLVINTIIVTLVTLVVVAAIGWWQLYPVQNTSTFFYRVTRIIPVPVASVDGQNVRYSDYLMYYSGSAHYLQQNEQVNLTSQDGRRQVAYIKRKTLDKAIADAYVQKLAQTLHLSVTNDELAQANADHLNTADGRISQEAYNASTLTFYGWQPDEEQASVRSQLLKNKVVYAIDTVAKQQANKAAELLRKQNVDFDQVATELGGTGDGKVAAGVSGLVPVTNRDGGLTQAAGKLKMGDISDVIESTTGDGYYFVKLLQHTDTQLSYAYIRIPLTEFDTRLAALKKEGKIHEYINVPQVEAQQKQ